MAIYFFIIYAINHFFIPLHDIISFAAITHIGKFNTFLPIFSIGTVLNAYQRTSAISYFFFANVRMQKNPQPPKENYGYSHNLFMLRLPPSAPT